VDKVEEIKLEKNPPSKQRPLSPSNKKKLIAEEAAKEKEELRKIEEKKEEQKQLNRKARGNLKEMKRNQNEKQAETDDKK